ncbi:hypothetical protein LEP1GSC036_4036 [Leptospira weilii str. 2006001853]|uniref:Uncharacterized protein n=1 Tax=Leptospira weilii str. 2006001853 TaxID=1001589 RepID=A0A828Z7F2_9LEPT|nr:hypothetical protein LEP1GSC036_4036 [Leptospira weilii str. 2006001853]
MLLFYFRSFKRKFCNFKGSAFCRVLPIKFKISNHKEFFRFMNAVYVSNVSRSFRGDLQV